MVQIGTSHPFTLAQNSSQLDVIIYSLLLLQRRTFRLELLKPLHPAVPIVLLSLLFELRPEAKRRHNRKDLQPLDADGEEGLEVQRRQGRV
jgi:hypothetical protein